MASPSPDSEGGKEMWKMFSTKQDYDRAADASREIVRVLQGFSLYESYAILDIVRNILVDAAAKAYLDEKHAQESDIEK